jgi:hypothetical protein
MTAGLKCITLVVNRPTKSATICLASCNVREDQPHPRESRGKLTSDEKLLVLNDFFAWSGGELRTSDGRILVYLEAGYPFKGFDEDKVTAYLQNEIYEGATDGGAEDDEVG